MTGTARDITEHKRGEEHIHLLMREITHRSKNLLAVIQAMARQTKVGSKTVADFERAFSGACRRWRRRTTYWCSGNGTGCALPTS